MKSDLQYEYPKLINQTIISITLTHNLQAAAKCCKILRYVRNVLRNLVRNLVRIDVRYAYVLKKYNVALNGAKDIFRGEYKH